MASETAREIESQPACWRRAVELAAASAEVLPAEGERVAVIGCGTSWFMGQAYASAREATGRGETDAFTPTEFPRDRRYDRVVAISRSGTTTEVVRAIEATGAPVTAITAVTGSPVATAADQALALDFADERSVVQTRFATSTLALLRAHIGEDLGGAIADADRALGAPLPVDPSAIDHAVFLGHGWSIGIAAEAALKLREAAQLHTESYPAMEYRHGPIALAGPASLVWILGSPDPSIAEDVRATGADVRTAELDPMAELVLVHRLALALAGERGLDPDHPRHLTRSVVLASAGDGRSHE
jgi:fructoselysine-6-P-deglycase FrlB-like protein